MANKKISQLNENITPTSSDFFPIVNNGETKKQSLSGLTGLFDQIGIVEVPVTWDVDTGGNHYARFGTIDVLDGNASDFSITAGTTTTSDQLFCTKDIIQCYASYYFQCISQTGSQRVFASLFGGVRSRGGAVSFPTSQNNARISQQVNLGYVQANQPISSTLAWDGSGTLTINPGSVLIINYKKL